MITKIGTVLLACLLLQAVCVAQNSKVVTDDTIAFQVKIKLADDPLVQGGAINVTAENGVVTLSGAVRSNPAKAKAAKLAQKVKGVKQVVNDLVVNPHPGQ